MPQPEQTIPPDSPELILIAEAARRCGWRRANTFRERFIASDKEALAMGLAYDERGRALVDAASVAVAVAAIERERAERAPDWRIKNLKGHARTRPETRPPKRKRKRRRKIVLAKA